MSEDKDKQDPEAEGWATAKTLAEALPYIQIYDRETVVIKYGGHAMGESEVAKLFAADVVLLKLMGVHPVVVHGGGPQISAILDRAGVKSAFVDGLRVTDAATMQIAEMVLSGSINKEIANWITLAGREAETIRRSAEEQAKRLVDETEITRSAKAQAGDTLNRAEQRSRELMKAANDYVDDALRRTEEAVNAALNEVQQSRVRFRSLAGARQNVPAPQQEEPDEQTEE